MSVHISIYLHWGNVKNVVCNLTKVQDLEKNSSFNHMLKNDFQSTSINQPINQSTCQHRYSESPKVVRTSVILPSLGASRTSTTRRVYWSVNTHFT